MHRISICQTNHHTESKPFTMNCIAAIIQDSKPSGVISEIGWLRRHLYFAMMTPTDGHSQNEDDMPLF